MPETPPVTDRYRKLYSMDFARGVAVLLVATGHFFDLHPSSLEAVNFIRRAISLAGLPLFFVLSGYLLSRQMTFYQEKYTAVRQFNLWGLFFVYRLLRIYPAYLVSLGILAVAYTSSHIDIAVHVLNIHNFFPNYIMSVNPVFWTLAVEFQWYLLFPLLFGLFSPGKKFSHTLFMLFLLFLAGFFWRQYFIVRFQHGAIPFETAFMLGHGQLIAHLFAFCLGIVLFHYSISEKGDTEGSAGHAPFIAGILICLTGGLLTVWGVISPSSAYGIHLNTGPVFFLPLGGAFLLYWMMQHESLFNNPKKYFINSIRWTGVISYSLYLWHYPLLTRFQGVSQYAVLDFIISFTVAIALSWVSYILVERNFLRLKSLFLRRLSNVQKVAS